MKIEQLIEYDIELFKENVLKLNSYDDLCRHYNYASNGKSHKFFKELILKYNLSANHWDRHKKIRKYLKIEKTCPQCGIKFTVKNGGNDNKTCCSCKCSNVYFSTKRHTEQSKCKRSDSIKKYLLSVGKIPLQPITCIICGKEKLPKRITQKCCSNKCSAILKSQNPEYIKNLKEGVQKSIREGRHKGWKSRNILSYPEKFFINVLNNNSINFVPNKPFNGYFLDFALENKMINLEIDGKQHKYPDRKESDILRDNELTNNGWKVYRIEWNSINTDVGKQLMKDKIDKFLEYYNNL